MSHHDPGAASVSGSDGARPPQATTAPRDADATECPAWAWHACACPQQCDPESEGNIHRHLVQRAAKHAIAVLMDGDETAAAFLVAAFPDEDMQAIGEAADALSQLTTRIQEGRNA